MNKILLLLLISLNIYSQEYIQIDKRLSEEIIEIICIPIGQDGAFLYEDKTYISNPEIKDDARFKYYRVGISIKGEVAKVDGSDDVMLLKIDINNTVLLEWKRSKDDILPSFNTSGFKTEYKLKFNDIEEIKSGFLLRDKGQEKSKFKFSIRILQSKNKFMDLTK